MRTSKDKKVFIIAEAGVNHNGSAEVAKKMIGAAAKAGADAVKFQTFKAESIVSEFSPKARYQEKITGNKESQFEMIKKLELDLDAHKKLIEYCKKKRIDFLSTPFDLESIELLHNLGLQTFKISSGEITNLPYLRKIGALKKKIVISTGMANLKEVAAALNTLIKRGTPKKNITILHCNTEYPTPYKDVNLKAMQTIKDKFNVKVGYSDHTLGTEIPIAATALGASVIEKHFTLDKNMKGPDHKASLEPDEFRNMVRAVRNAEEALGSGVKRNSPSEIKNKIAIRKSLVAAEDIKKWEKFTGKNITAKRPAIGISPMKWQKIIGKTAKKDFKKDEPIKL